MEPALQQHKGAYSIARRLHMYRTVLVPLDGSSFGEHALQLATTLARRSGARVELVHVHSPNPDASTWEPVTPFRYEGLEQSEREWDGTSVLTEEHYLIKCAEQLKQELNGGTTCKVLSGPTIPALEQEIRDSRPDLIVMATHGRGGFSRAWLGSVADALVRNVHRPILLVRTPDESAPAAPVRTERILIPLDGSPLSETIVQHAVDLGANAPTSFTLLRVVPPVWTAPEIMSEPDALTDGALKDRVTAARDYLARVADSMTAQTVDVTMDVVVGVAAGASILDYARNADIDVIAMATHGRGGVKRMILGSVADKVLRGATMPVLLYHPA
jgi:nucleotide-binding universal stress UspA family protein